MMMISLFLFLWKLVDLNRLFRIGRLVVFGVCFSVFCELLDSRLVIMKFWLELSLMVVLVCCMVSVGIWMLLRVIVFWVESLDILGWICSEMWLLVRIVGV